MNEDREIKSVIDEHPPIPTERLQEMIERMAIIHNEAEEKQVEYTPAISIGICVIISIVAELLKYRDHYGFIELPNEDWIVEEEK